MSVSQLKNVLNSPSERVERRLIVNHNFRVVLLSVKCVQKRVERG
jgi:hypothetical protein